MRVFLDEGALSMEDLETLLELVQKVRKLSVCRGV
jgi:hypothetical protein